MLVSYFCEYYLDYTLHVSVCYIWRFNMSAEYQCLSLTACHYLNDTDCHCLSRTVTNCHGLSLSVTKCHLSLPRFMSSTSCVATWCQRPVTVLWPSSLVMMSSSLTGACARGSHSLNWTARSSLTPSQSWVSTCTSTVSWPRGHTSTRTVTARSTLYVYQKWNYRMEYVVKIYTRQRL